LNEQEIKVKFIFRVFFVVEWLNAVKWW
jgi:hypothetical protein